MKKKNVGLVIAIIIAAVMVIGVGAFSALYFLTDLFKPEEQLFWKYISNNSQLTKVVTNENEENQKQWKENNSYTSEGTLKLSMTSKEKIQEINLKTTSKHNHQTDRTYSDITLYNGEEELLKTSYINSDDVYSIKCEDIYDQYYIGFRNSNLKEFATKMGFPEESIPQIPDSIPLNIADNTSKLTEEELKYLSETYFNILMENIAREKYTKLEKKNITIGDKTYETVGHQLELNQNDIKQILVAILTKAQNDEQTIAMFEKVLLEENQTEPIDVQEILNKLLESVQKQKLDEVNIKISVYNAGKQIVKTQVNINDQAELTLDVDTSNESKEYATLNVKAINAETSEEQEVMQLKMEKQKLNNMVNYTFELTNNVTEDQIMMNTSLGNVINNQIENNSKITILENDATIETSYYKTTRLANEEVEIQELTNSNSVIVNNYSMDQLGTFFTSLGEKASQVLTEKIGKLNIQLSDTEDISYYVEGIASSIFTVINANGTSGPIEAVEATAITLLNQITKSSEEGIIVKADSAAQYHDIDIIKETMMLTQSMIQMEALSGKDFTNMSNIKTSVEEQFLDKYEIIDWGNISFNSDTKKIEGVITIKSGNKMYVVDFTKQSVEEKS